MRREQPEHQQTRVRERWPSIRSVCSRTSRYGDHDWQNKADRRKQGKNPTPSARRIFFHDRNAEVFVDQGDNRDYSYNEHERIEGRTNEEPELEWLYGDAGATSCMNR